MAYKSGKCWCCQEVAPVQGHHIKPLEYGGDKDGRMVDICARCHTTLHYEAEHYYTHGKYFAHGIEALPYFERLSKLITKVVDTKMEWEESDKSDNDQRRMSQLSWDTSEELALAHAVKRAMGFTSLERAIKECVFTMAKALQKKGRL